MNTGEAILSAGRALLLSNYTMSKYAAKATPEQADFLLELFGCELEYRKNNKHQRLMKRATFPVPKSFDGYDWSNVVLPSSITREELMNCDFVGRAENIIAYGSVGVGKTHLAIAVGMKACEMGMKVKFITTSEIVYRLMDANDKGDLEKLLVEYESNDLTILDEFGYVPIDRDGSRLLFQVISRLYESGSVILTTNLEFSRWGSILTEEQMASALVDRLLHHGHVITFKGDSYRMRHALMNAKGSGSTN